MYTNPDDLKFFKLLIGADDSGQNSISAFCEGVFCIKTEGAMQQFFRGCVQYYLQVRPELTPERAEQIARSNIGYCFGEGIPNERKLLWYNTVGAEHPWFGITTPNPIEAFLIGCKMGSQHKLLNDVIDELNQQLMEDLEKKNVL